MAVHEIAPSADLADFVDAYWWHDAAGVDATIRVIPDGCADVMFDADGAWVVGTMTRPLQARTSPGMFGIRFRPGRAAVALRTLLPSLPICACRCSM